MVIHFSELKKIVTREIIDRYDHNYLNDLKEYKRVQPTCENMADQIFDILEKCLAKMAITLVSVNLFETPSSFATVTRG